MKKLFYFVAVCTLLLSAGSCQKEIGGGIDDRGAKVNFTLQVSDVQTKAIADASNIDILHWEVYGDDVDTASEPLAEGFETDPDGDGAFSLDLSLILDQTYNFIFWAQVDREEGKEHYDVSDLRKVGIKSYDDEMANDESRAAFFAHKEIYVTGSIDETITLYRPFSQLNIGTEHYDVPSMNLIGQLKVNHSEVTVTGIADTFNTLTGKGEGKQMVHFQKNVTPNGSKDATEKILEVNEHTYHWLGMNYFIVNGDNDNVKVDMTFHTTHGNVDMSIENVPIRENYRTNIIGDLLTTEAVFNIIVDERFQTPDIVVGDEVGSDPIPDFEITQDEDGITYTVFTPEGLEAWREAAHEDALKDTDTKVNLILGADIILETVEGQANWTPVGTVEHPYDGFVDGKGFSISDMTIETDDEAAGFIGAWDGEDGATAVQNLTFYNVHILSANNHGTGTVIGYGKNDFVIKNCHIKGGSISGIGGGPCGGLFGGGFGGGFDTGGSGSGGGFGGTAVDCSNSASVYTITYYVGGIGGFGNAIDCTNTGSVTGKGYYIGGILGGSNGTVTGNENSGKVTGGVNAGGIVGGIQDGKLENNSNKGDVYGTEEGALGGIYGWLDGSTVQNNNVSDPQCIIKVIVVDKDYTVKVEDEVITYTVYTLEGLETWREAAHQDALSSTYDKKVNLVLAADIELPAVEEGQSNWTPVGTSGKPYDGIVDGGDFTIKNLTINGGSNIGFISTASYGGTVVSNLKLDNVNISGGKNVGAVIGQVTDDGKVDNCHILGGKVTGTGDHVGGILGYSEYYGGVRNSSNAADVSGASYVGGISGRAYATASVNYGDVTGTGDYVGGVYAAYSYGNTSDNKNYGNVSGIDRVAGITGYGTSSYSHNEGNVTGRDNVAGISSGNGGSYLGNLGECTNKGNISGRNYVAGILSNSRKSLADCKNEGKIEGEQYVSGIAASFESRYNNNNTVLTRCENNGEITGDAYVAGIVAIVSGKYNCNILENVNTADIAGGDKAAAFVAHNENANVTGNTNSGDITGYTNIGHFVGQQNPSYSPDTVTGNVSTGNLNILENNDFTRTVDGTTVSYIVYTQKGFETWVAEAHKSVEDNYVCNLTLETDIDLPVPAAGESNWTPIGNYKAGSSNTHPNSFSGTIDGKGHTISNLTINTTVPGAGFIGQINGGSIKNLTLADVNINSTSSHVAAFAGAISSTKVRIENCHVESGTVQGSGSYVAGIASGSSESVLISKCSNKANITGNGNYVGGIAGYISCADCYNYGTVVNNSKNGYTGGITGRGDVTGSTNYANVTAYKTVAGITGAGDATGCRNSGNITGTDIEVCGISGIGYVTDSHNTGTIISTGQYAAGIVGQGGASGCTNSGDVTGKTYVGGISGSVTTDVVTNCQNSGTVTATGDYVGGIAGRHTNNSSASKATEFSSCENTADVTSSGNYVGGIVGESNSGYCVIKESINRGAVSGKDYVGGIAGSSKSVTDCDNYGNVSGNQSVGGISGAKYDAAHTISGSENKAEVTVTGVSYIGGIVGFADAGTVTDNVHSGKAIGQDKVAGIVGYNEEAVVTYNTHSGHVEGYTSVGAFVGGQDSAFSPDTVTGNVDNGTEIVLSPTDYTREVVGTNILYKVYTANGLLAWREEAAAGAEANSYVVSLELMADITLPEGTVWAPVGRANYQPYTFKGNIEGNYFTVYNLTLNSTSEYTGFVGALSGTIQNINFSNVSVTASHRYAAVIVGDLYSGSVKNCNVLSGTITSSANYLGAVVGRARKDSEISSCSNYAAVSGKQYVGGVVGQSAGNVVNCSNYSLVSGNSYCIGGVVGDSNGTISNCFNKGDITSTVQSNTGGIAGRGSVSSSQNTGNVTGISYTGGITGYGDVTDSENSGVVTGTSYVGGITGSGTVSGSDNTGSVKTTKSDKYVGGVTGNGGATDCNNYGDVIRVQGSSSEYTGGISGYSSQPVTNCTNSGKVVGSLYVGGIAGYISGTSVTDCENYGVVSADRWHIGGIVGHCLKSTVSGCTNKADISSVGSTASNATSVAGIAGYVEGDTSSISGNVNEADIVGYRALGGIVGRLVSGSVSGNKHTGNISWLDNPDGYNGLIVGLNNGGTVADDNEGTGTVAQQ